VLDDITIDHSPLGDLIRTNRVIPSFPHRRGDDICFKTWSDLRRTSELGSAAGAMTKHILDGIKGGDLGRWVAEKNCENGDKGETDVRA